jgi:argininosuccinate synthase
VGVFEYERGVRLGLNGRRLGLVELLEQAADMGARHGVGIVDHIEDRVVGLKVRDIYEVPAATIVLLAHRELEKLVGTIHQNQFKPMLDQRWAYLVYAGLWLEPLRTDLDAYMEAANEQVTGTIGVKLFKGSARPVTRESPNAVYDASLASFAESGGLFSQEASPGFIELWSLQSRMAWRVRHGGAPHHAHPGVEHPGGADPGVEHPGVDA